MVVPLFVMFALIGKWAYTSRILYWNFFSTPSKRLLMWLQTLRSMDNCLDLAKYIRARTSWPLLANQSSMGKCLKSRFKVPFFPVTSTFFALMVILMPLGTLMDSSCTKVFMATAFATLEGCRPGSTRERTAAALQP